MNALINHIPTTRANFMGLKILTSMSCKTQLGSPDVLGFSKT